MRNELVRLIVGWFFVLVCLSLGVSGLLVGEYGEALQFFLLSGLIINVYLGDK